METAGHVSVEVRAALAPFERGMAEAERQTKAFDQSARRSLGGTEKAMAAMNRGARQAQATILSLRGALAGLGGALVIRKVLTDFAAFERGLIGVGKTTDITGRDLERLGEGVQMIAREVPVATTELLEITQAAGQLGVSGSDNLLRFTETVGKLGLASNLAGEQAATTLARILTVTGTQVGQVDRLGSTIVRLGNNFAATEAEIAEVTTRVAQATAQFNVSAAEVTGIGTALRAVGVQAEAGGTVIGRAFQAINDAVRQGGEEMQAFTQITGKSQAELRRLFEDDPTAAFQAFVDGLGRINDSGGDVAAALSAVGLEGVRIIQVMGTLAARSGVLTDALGQANDEWEKNTALNKEALVAAQSFTAQMQLAGNAFNEAAVAIGRGMAPAIVEATQRFREFIEEAERTGQIEQWAERTGATFKFLADNIDLVTAAAGALVGLRLGAAFGPWGALIGTVAGGMAAFALATGDATDAAEVHVRILGGLKDTLREVDAGNKNAADSAAETARANISAARAALQRAEAELRLAQAMAQAEMSSMVVGAPAGSTSGDPRIRAAREEVEKLQQALLEAGLEYKAFQIRTGMASSSGEGEGDGAGTPPGTPIDPFGGGGSDTDPNQFQQAIQMIRDRTDAIRLEQQVLGESIGVQEAARAEMDLMNAAREAGINLGPQEIALINEVAQGYGRATEELQRMAQAQQDAMAAQQFFGDMAFGALEGIIIRGEDASDVMRRLAQSIASAALEAALLGQGPLAGLFGTAAPDGGVGGLFGGFLSGIIPGRASGGPVKAGQPYIVGERRPELFIPSENGIVLPQVPQMGAGGASAGDTILVQMAPITIDARGADQAGLYRVERKVDELRREMPNMAVEAVREADSRRTS